MRFGPRGVVARDRYSYELFAATLLSARKIIDALDSPKPNPGKDFFIDKAIKEAAAILERNGHAPKRDWKMAKAWLFGELTGESDRTPPVTLSVWFISYVLCSCY
jgi:hypothetical protein